jgi:hypothetical protein
VLQRVLKRNVFRQTNSDEGVFQRRMSNFAQANRALQFRGYPVLNVDWLFVAVLRRTDTSAPL